MIYNDTRKAIRPIGAFASSDRRSSAVERSTDHQRIGLLRAQELAILARREEEARVLAEHFGIARKYALKVVDEKWSIKRAQIETRREYDARRARAY